MSTDRHEVRQPDPAEVADAMGRIAEQTQRLTRDFLERQKDEEAPASADPLNIGSAFFELTRRLMANPAQLVEAQMDFWRAQMSVWQSATSRALGGDVEPAARPARDDRRFRDPAWQDNLVFDYIKQSYLLSARWLLNTVHDVEGLDRLDARKVDFYTRQFVDAMSPSNFLMTNPEVLRTTVESGGQNLVNGLGNLLSDLERGKGRLAISMTDTDAFEVGGNIATSPGSVVWQNELMQLVQYSPTTPTVRKRPLLIVPPWINKFYILDLRERNSFIRWAVSQGLTVFVISWVNPDGDLADTSFADYVINGPLAALDAIEQATGEREVNAIGYCIGGTLMAATLARMAATGDDRIASITFFTTMVDFEEAGDLGVFVDEQQLEALEERMSKDGYLEGSDMATTFNMLRANDLIWSFVVNNYLLGREPFPFDLLYWNSDSTRMPSAMHSYYLREMYLANRLIEPEALEIDGVGVDLSRITIPVFILSTKEDHIAPWMSTYRATHIYGGPVRFCLAESGHIAGVINPPADPPKYGYYLNRRKPASPEKWFEGADRHDGSWWPEWRRWLSRHAGAKVPARTPGDGALPVIENAPGSYVKASSS
ncbi:MAG: class I poly(R)-hydroxyalkanoic acid synthase [Alphaproteobacteria bacterium]|nr:class I poly(R)-hydroxyalkanoic acid synthase [Alphaproteobacteria bacterium]